MVTVPRLRALRERKALTQGELAERAALNRTTIARLESGGQNAFPSTVRKLAKVLDVEPEQLMAPTPPPPADGFADGEVTRFLESHPGLAELVAEAQKQIPLFFPDARVSVQVHPDPDYGTDEQLFIGIISDLDEYEADEALEAFDRDWWAHHISKGAGLVCIDLAYE
jgi:transcriptional regulator with XRE-family HTH domain